MILIIKVYFCYPRM